MPIFTKAGRMQHWGAPKNPEHLGTAFDQDCCPCECGCALCFQDGDQLIATSSSPCARLDGLTKYFTKDGVNTWTADQDGEGTPGFDGCLFMNPGPAFDKTRIYCDEGEIKCPGESGCFRYYMDFNAFECGRDQGHCADSCSCTPISGFYLDFLGLEMNGGEYTPPSGPPVRYTCGCTYPDDPDGCTWPTTISWHVERLIHCCCSNLQRDDPVPTLYAEIHGEGSLCTGTMELAGGIMSIAGGNGCRTWDTPTDITFTCADESSHSMHLSLACDSTHDDYGECCTDYKMYVTIDGGAPQSAYATSSCTCAPLAMRFGPFTLADCCDEFYLLVTEY